MLLNNDRRLEENGVFGSSGRRVRPAKSETTSRRPVLLKSRLCESFALAADWISSYSGSTRFPYAFSARNTHPRAIRNPGITNAIAPIPVR